jgi:hypothetical protein
MINTYVSIKLIFDKQESTIFIYIKIIKIKNFIKIKNLDHFVKVFYF